MCSVQFLFILFLYVLIIALSAWIDHDKKDGGMSILPLPFEPKLCSIRSTYALVVIIW